MAHRTTSLHVLLSLLVLTTFCALPGGSLRPEKETAPVKGVLAAPTDAAEVPAQIALVDNLKSVVPDSGAVLYFLSTAKQHLRESREALILLQECLALREGFDPLGARLFWG